MPGRGSQSRLTEGAAARLAEARDEAQRGHAVRGEVRVVAADGNRHVDRAPVPRPRRRVLHEGAERRKARGEGDQVWRPRDAVEVHRAAHSGRGCAASASFRARCIAAAIFSMACAFSFQSSSSLADLKKFAARVTTCRLPGT